MPIQVLELLYWAKDLVMEESGDMTSLPSAVLIKEEVTRRN